VALVYLSMMFVMSVLIVFFRLMDEIFFPSYRKIQIKEPVFIISNPRSGTTFLHRLMCADDEKFVYTRTFHTIIPAISFSRLLDVFAAIDKRIGRPMHTLLNWVDKKMFGGWKDVHALGFNKAEEDEGLYFLCGISPAISLVTPYLHHFRELYILDHFDEKRKKRIQRYYQSTLQRWMYVLGKDKQFLCKSVMSTGRLELLRELFPDLKLIYLVRNPYEAVPSFVDMFSSTWKYISPTIPENSNLYREIAHQAIIYYQYFNEQQKALQRENWMKVKYEDLVNDPTTAVLHIYRYFHFDISSAIQQNLNKESENTRSYKSKHQYSLEQYGLTRAEIYQALSFVFDEHEFKP